MENLLSDWYDTLSVDAAVKWVFSLNYIGNLLSDWYNAPCVDAVIKT